MSTKQKLKRAYISVSYPRHADILSLTYRFGIQGKCASYDLILSMSEASGGVIDRDAFFYTCKINEVEDAEGFLNFCLQKGIFIEVAGGYTNSIVAKDQENYAKVLREDKERKRNSSGNKPESDRKLDIDNDIDNDLNNKLRLSGKFNTPEIKKAVSAWRDKLKKAGRTYDQIQLDAHCINFNTPEKFLEALNFSLGLSKTNNLYSPPDKDPPKNKDKPASVSHAESMHPAVRAQREREAKESLERLGMGGLAK